VANASLRKSAVLRQSAVWPSDSNLTFLLVMIRTAFYKIKMPDLFIKNMSVKAGTGGTSPLRRWSCCIGKTCLSPTIAHPRNNLRRSTTLTCWSVNLPCIGSLLEIATLDVIQDDLRSIESRIGKRLRRSSPDPTQGMIMRYSIFPSTPASHLL